VNDNSATVGAKNLSPLPTLLPLLLGNRERAPMGQNIRPAALSFVLKISLDIMTLGIKIYFLFGRAVNHQMMSKFSLTTI
jgi:hypothetical protein